MLDFRFHHGRSGRFPLSRTEKTRGFAALHAAERPASQTRRDFLKRSCQALGAAFLPGLLRAPALPLHAETAELHDVFHLQPHYRSPTTLDAILLKARAGLDEFITEKFADEIAGILARWSTGLRHIPPEWKTIAAAIAPGLLGGSLHPAASTRTYSGAGLEAHHLTFEPDEALHPDAFTRELGTYFGGFREVLTADFQVTRIDVKSAAGAARPDLRTRVRYEIVATGHDFYREQRVGDWEMEWAADASGAYRVQRWHAGGETRSRAQRPFFAEITQAALGGNASYGAQLLRGTDYWRTVLDGASGIDLYGHNGVSVGDIDGDGFDDLYVCQPAGVPNRMYRNRGDGTFEDITEASGTGVLENTACALLLDVDNDGKQDLIVVRASGPVLFMNQGGGKFRLKEDAFRFTSPPQGTFTGAAAADYDRDGWLDIYFCLYVYYQGADQYKYPSPYYDARNGPPNFLMRNQRDGTFRDVTRESGLDRNNTRYSFCCGWNDLSGDGWPDLYVVNDFGRKNLYRNNGDGTFTDIAEEAGVEDTGAGMSVCWLDADRDGKDDLYVGNMWTAAGERIATQDNFQREAAPGVRELYRKHAMGNSLLRQAGASTFTDVTGAAGVGMGRWAWSSDAWDFDHDGNPDLYIANGMVSGPSRDDLNSFFWRQVVARSPQQAKPSHTYEQGWNAINELIRADGTWSGYERNVFYANHGDGTFSDVSGALGLDFREDGRAFALADFDHDGREELFLKNRNAPVLRVLKNVAEELPPAIAFRLRGVTSNRDAIGAVVTVETAAGKQTRSLQAGSGFLSQHSKDLFFGLGAERGAVKAWIRWPSGATQSLTGLPINHRIEVREGEEAPAMQPFAPMKQTPARNEVALSGGGSGQENAAGSAVETWLLAPVSAPDFSLPDLAGKPHALSSLRGKPVVLAFLTMESPRCRETLAQLSEHYASWTARGLEIIAVSLGANGIAKESVASGLPLLQGSDDTGAIYNIVFRYVFDRHRELPLPAAFLIDARGDIVKIYQGALDPAHVEHDAANIPQTAAARMAAALPFPGVAESNEFMRNYLSYGSVFFQRGYYEQAGAAFERALRDDPESAEAMYGIGSVQLNQQKMPEAQRSFERATRMRASFPDTLANSWNNLGLIAAREGRTDEAIGYFAQALQLSPEHVVALENLGSAYRQRKDWDKARQSFERALAVSPDDAEANYGLGMVLAQTDDTEHARERLLRALQTRPAYPEALNNLGILYLRTQRRDEAVAKFEECIRVAPGFDQAYLNLARVYVLENTPDKARAVLQELLRQRPGHAAAQEMLRQLGQ